LTVGLVEEEIMSEFEQARKFFAIGLMWIGGILFVFNLLLFVLYGPPIQNVGDLSIFGLVLGIFSVGFILHTYFGEEERPCECDPRHIRQRQRRELQFGLDIQYRVIPVTEFGRSKRS
jgi:hypothetical protein